MIAKILIWLSLVLSMFIMIVPNVLANNVESEGNAWGFRYQITQVKNQYSWKISHEGQTSVVIENKKNKEELYKYKQAVSDINVKLVYVTIFSISFLILTILTILLHKKNILSFRTGGAIIALFAVITLIVAIAFSEDLKNSLSDARFYFSRII